MTVAARNYHTDAIHVSGVTMTTATWHQLELWLQMDGADDELAVDLDGRSVFDLDDLDFGGGRIRRVLTGIGWQGSGDAVPTAIYVDDVVLESGCD